MGFRRFTIVAIFALLASGLTLAACGGDDGNEEAESADFSEADLDGLVLAADEAPEGLQPVNDPGAGVLEGDGSVDLLAELGGVGLEAERVATFEADDKDADPSYVDSIALLFTDPDAASEGLALLEQELSSFLASDEPLPEPPLGAESWGAGGELDGGPAFVGAWRVGDVVQVATAAGTDEEVVAAAASGLATSLEKRATE